MGDGDQANAPFGSLVRHLRHAAWLTQEDLAEKSGLSPRTIQAIERGRVSRPRRESVRLLADAFGLEGTARTGFEAAARPSAHIPYERRPCWADHRCACLAELASGLGYRMGEAGQSWPGQVDLRGLGQVADLETVLARLARALGSSHR